MSTVPSLIRPALFRPVSAGFTAVRVVIAAVVAFTVTVAGFSAPAFAAPLVAAPAAVAPASVQAPSVVPAQSTPSVQAGVFVPVQGRALDTRSGLGGITGPVTAQTWHPFQVLGAAGVPTSGVDAVLVSLTVVNGTGVNVAQLVPNTARHHDTTNLYSGENDTISNTVAVAVGTDGKLALYSTSSQQFIVDVQGYFTAGDTPAPGAFVSVPQSRVVDTRNGTGYPAGQWSGAGIKSLALKGKGGVPDTATAVFANITVLNDNDTAELTFTTQPGGGFDGGADPGTTINFRGSSTTAVAAVLNLNAAGVVDIKHNQPYATGFHVLVDIQGYFDGQVSDSAFTTVESRIYDSRVSNTPISGFSSVEVQIAGVGGLPAASTSLAGVAMNITPITTGTGNLTVWPSDETQPGTSTVNYTADSVSNTVVVRPSTVTGKVKIYNAGPGNVHVILDSQGWFSNANLLPPVTVNGAESGSRGKASMVGHTLTDAAKLALNPTNGNAVFTGRLFNLRGIGQDMNVAWRYNSKYDHRPTLSMGRLETALRVDPATGNMMYTAPDGGWYTFMLAAGVFTMAPELNASLTKVSTTEYWLRFNDTGITNVYQDDGTNFALVRSVDANTTNPNTVTYTYGNGRLTQTTDTQGRTVSYVYNDTRNLNQPSAITDNSLNRTVNIEYGGGEGRMSKITDATGAVTTFAYTSGKLSSFTDGRTNTTALAYAADGWVNTVTYGQGSTAAATWTLTHSTDGSLSYLTDPNSKQSTYTLDASKTRVLKATDPNGNESSGTFDGHDNRLTTTNGLGQTTTAAYNANNSLTKITSPLAGATGTAGDASFTYPTAVGDPLLNYRPDTSTSSEGNANTIQYDPNTKNPSAILTPDNLGGTPRRYYQGDAAGTSCGAKPGSLCRSTDGNGNETTYSYDAAGNVAAVTWPAPLGSLAYTYDAAGRVATAKDGKNQTATYTYDNNDRLTQVRYAVTCVPATCVAYTYDNAGNLTTRVDAAGTTTYTWDAQNRPTGKTIGGVTTTVTYDGASNILTSVDPLGTVAYRYDGANRLAALAEPGGSCPATPVFPNSTKCTGFEYDKANRRTVTKYPNGVKNTTTYDGAGKITDIAATNTSGTVLEKRAYTYTLNGAKDGGLRKTMTTDSGSVTTYGYDKLNRLTSAVKGTVTESWTYDANSNRLADTKTGAATVYYAYNAADQLCWHATATGTCTAAPSGAVKYGYDANGNTTLAGSAGTTQAYNVFDQFTSNTSGSTVTNYTYAGTRNDERITAGSTSFLNGTLGVTQQTKSGAATSFIRDPDGTLISMRTSTGASYYYTTDAIGSTIMLTDSAQAKAVEYKYDSWGVQTSSTGTHAATNPWTYAGGYNDTTSNRIKFGARYYNPSRGRFTQPDPSGQEQNRYLYAAADPISNTDPSGLLFGDTDYGCAPYNTSYCTGVANVPYPPDGMTAKCRVSLGFSMASVFVPGWTPWAFAGVFVAAVTC
ncbi:RHS repeat-associated core domain-containing protein [Arthrobacter sp. KFRI-F3372]|nr:RHS repeat-associated core domain-containing protein [Arthrobacter sp. KFRI-F3372]